MAGMKDSGVEWIGEIPEEWQIGRISHRYALTLGKMVESIPTSPNKEKLPYICAANVKWGGLDSSVQKEMYFDKLESKSYAVDKGDLLITEGGSVGTSCIYKGEFGSRCHIQNSVIKACGCDRISNVFLCYWLEFISNSGYLDVLCNKATISHYTKDKVSKTPFPLIGRPEEAAIVERLNGLVEPMARAISTLETQISTLERYRASVIHEAVTRGLDPTAPTKPSGVDWIGDIPQGWEMKPLGYLGAFQNGISKDGSSFGSGYPFVSYGDAYNNRVLPCVPSGLVQSTAEERYRYSVHYGDVLFTRTSETIDEIAYASTCLETIDDATFAGFLIRFRPSDKRLDPRFGSYYFRSPHLRKYFSREMVIVTRASLGQQLLKRLPVLLPPRQEQAVIADYLDARTAAIDTVIATKRRQLDVLKRRRQSLIYEYVTGKRRVSQEG